MLFACPAVEKRSGLERLDRCSHLWRNHLSRRSSLLDSGDEARPAVSGEPHQGIYMEFRIADTFTDKHIHINNYKKPR